jgi:hypothetical protein
MLQLGDRRRELTRPGARCAGTMADPAVPASRHPHAPDAPCLLPRRARRHAAALRHRARGRRHHRHRPPRLRRVERRRRPRPLPARDRPHRRSPRAGRPHRPQPHDADAVPPGLERHHRVAPGDRWLDARARQRPGRERQQHRAWLVGPVAGHQVARPRQRRRHARRRLAAARRYPQRQPRPARRRPAPLAARSSGTCRKTSRWA